ncbi:precorrin-6A synthase (deacetylating) [Pararhodospirillum photometricum]|uniref:Precorrin-6A synthase [deacetylating] n=1 Tax=Pararhodospirillum photometricum DSM 122 TaxID=1150469 RepID=H6SPY5_PARPM|nr:precorrin-6A synthase (deacetylating) [Pararhodospirillum photometricum]CCG07255.1 Precorrin-6A synthase (Deacetylating) [Pararhodospirillum photometricum DSM 122]
MKTVHLIGIGPGDPEMVTVQAINTMKTVDVFFLLEKAGRGKESLLAVRRDILERYAGERPYRVVTAASPQRNRENPNYAEGVIEWRDERLTIIGDLIANELTEGQVGAFLVWGDPSLYDGMIESLSLLQRQGRQDFDFTVIPGITSVQVLTARHRIPLNRIAETITITTGRLLEDVAPADVTNAVVMLDSRQAFRRFAETGHEVYWGALLGSPDERLIAGPVAEVADAIEGELEAVRAQNGWVMDTYILRKP